LSTRSRQVVRKPSTGPLSAHFRSIARLGLTITLLIIQRTAMRTDPTPIPIIAGHLEHESASLRAQRSCGVSFGNWSAQGP